MPPESQQVEIIGVVPPQLGAVTDAFAHHFETGQELGARFTLCQEGEVILDLWAGHADRARTRPFDQTTLTPVFSTGKAVAALLIARLVTEGRLDYEQPVADVWPEFAAAGKAAVTVAEALSHQAGLAGLRGPMQPRDWYDWEAVCARIAAAAPLWPPGSASGYHPVTVGFIAGEIFRRIDGRMMNAALAEDVAGPFGLDLSIGLSSADRPRVSEMERPKAFAAFGPMTDILRLAFFSPWSQPGGGDPGQGRAAPIPSTNTHATAEALARLFAVMACEGALAGKPFLSPKTVRAASQARVRGSDLVLPFDIAWGAGLMRNEGLNIWGPGQETIGHAGWGGSCVFADPQKRLSGAYVMNRQSPHLIGDPRPKALIEAAYAALG
ncbi:MAG: serine hydrolase domain-containing protein [Caulobacteraceae bacterium]